jgi:hypothetical protein
LGKQKKVTGGHGWPTKHTRTWVGPRDKPEQQTNTIPTQPSP